MTHHFRLFMLAILIGSITAVPVLANDAPKTLLERLTAYKESFLQKAPQQKIDDYEQGIQQVEDSGVLEEALQVGETAPDFTLPNPMGKSINLNAELQKGPIVLIWYRGAWCPYCNIYLEEIQKNAEAFSAVGAQVIAISPEKPDEGFTLKEKLSLKFHVLSDNGSKVAQQYGVVYELPPKIAAYYQDAFDIHTKNNDESNLLPLAASYVIDTNGKVTYAYLNADYRERAAVETLLEEAEKIKNKKVSSDD